MVISSPFGTNLSTFPYLWTLHYTEWGLILILCVLDAKNKKNLTAISFFMIQITLDFINKVINYNYTFRTRFEISIKEILTATSSYTHNSVKLEMLQTLIEVFLRYVTFCRRKTFYGDGYDKIQELFNFKGNLVSHFKKPRAMSVDLGSKESFLRKSNSFLNTNGTLNIQFNCP